MENALLKDTFCDNMLLKGKEKQKIGSEQLALSMTSLVCSHPL